MAKQSTLRLARSVDCFVASLLAMTVSETKADQKNQEKL